MIEVVKEQTQEAAHTPMEYSHIRNEELGEWEPFTAPINILKRIDEASAKLGISEDTHFAAMAQMTVPLMKEFLSGNPTRAMAKMFVLMDLLQMLYGDDLGEDSSEFSEGVSDGLYDYIMKIFGKNSDAMEYIRGNTSMCPEKSDDKTTTA